MAAVLNSSHETLKQPCNRYIVSGLNQTILETSQISNLKDHYNLGEQLGWGQFGVIRSCTDKSTGEVLACKSIAKDRLVTAGDARSVKLEIEIMSRLSGHPNVVDLKAVYEDEVCIHLVMELCAGGELFHQLERHGRFSETEAKVLFKHLMQVISFCHEIGIVHRDLKPENILLATKASSSPIKLADFGLATYVEPGICSSAYFCLSNIQHLPCPRFTKLDVIMRFDSVAFPETGRSLHGTVGSPFYIAPEVLAGGYNQAADIWSAGVILYILLSGMPPFWGNTKSRIFEAVRTANLRFPSHPWDCITASAKELVKGMLCMNPSVRLTAQQVLEHIWLHDDGPHSEDAIHHNGKGGGEWHLGSNSFATLVTRSQDISFGTESPVICDAPSSPTFSCRSSFSPLAETTPDMISGGFTFNSGSGSNSLEFSPLSSMPSFTFFSPDPVTEPVTEQRSSLDFTEAAACEEASTGSKLVVPEPSLGCACQAREVERKPSEIKRALGAIGSRMLGIHSKRNRTIGLGEQLDHITTESVIRWASCTHLPTAPSLRSSLVC